MAEEFWPSESADLLDETERALREFQEHDPHGQDFRYATRSNGTRATPSLDLINVEIFCERALSAYRLLDGMSAGFEQAWQEWAENQP